MNPDCPKCQGKSIKNGKAKGKQRWKCRGCKFQFTRLEPKGKPLWMKIEAVLLYMTGVSLNAIANLLDVSTQAILNWVRDFARESYEKPKPGTAVVVELDEMWHFIGSKKTNVGSGKHLIVMTGDSLTGKLEIAILKPSISC